ncbi:hypothetical protein A9X03_27790 [Mycobacterium sp. E1715]|nr:hypothetical protein A5703_08790 [Mycobacterium sp. E188]OBG62910.1 hypothetical protein A5704_16225 [Mycobacterium sp. E735]OBG70313.1 hypothetical protein A5701_03485 [Mycobacterium sp. E3305]OBH10500.1 hypothetical protein A9X03_27790 [Mycobacterium sp. E1715]OBH41523.1 hypothetical protein A5691_18890 [Mycobacterium sp. E183]
MSRCSTSSRLSVFRSTLTSFEHYGAPGTRVTMTQTEPHQERTDGRRAFRLAIVVGGLALAGLAVAGFRTDLGADGPSATVPEAGTLQVNGTGTTKTVRCQGGYLSVSGQTNTVTVTGHCTSVSVSGHGNRVAVDSTDAVSTSGTGNAVTYHWGSPNVANAGAANTVKQG